MTHVSTLAKDCYGTRVSAYSGINHTTATGSRKTRKNEEHGSCKSFTCFHDCHCIMHTTNVETDAQIEKAGKNATFRSHVVVLEFVVHLRLFPIDVAITT